MPRLFTGPNARRFYGAFGFLILMLLIATAAWVRLAPTLPLIDATPRRPALLLLTAQGEPFARRGDYREVLQGDHNLDPDVLCLVCGFKGDWSSRAARQLS